MLDTGKTIAILGDTHADTIATAYRCLEKFEKLSGIKINAAVSCGDFGAFYDKHWDLHKYITGKWKVPIPTYVCLGNHEDYHVAYNWMNKPNMIPNMHLMLDGHVTAICGVRFGAIWGCFSHKSWEDQTRVEQARRVSIAQRRGVRKAMHNYKPAVEELKGRGKIDVLITHEAPLGLSPIHTQPPDFIKMQLGLDNDERASGCIGFNEIHEINKPKYHFFGHYHKHMIMQLEPVKTVCLNTFSYVEKEAFAVVDFSGEEPRCLYGC